MKKLLLLIPLFIACKKEEAQQPQKQQAQTTEHNISIKMSCSDTWNNQTLLKYYQNGNMVKSTIAPFSIPSTPIEVANYNLNAGDSVIVFYDSGVATVLFPDGSVNYHDYATVNIQLYVDGVYKESVSGDAPIYLRAKL